MDSPLYEAVWNVQQECARLDYTNRGEDKTAKWVAEKLIAALAEAERRALDQSPTQQGAGEDG